MTSNLSSVQKFKLPLFQSLTLTFQSICSISFATICLYIHAGSPSGISLTFDPKSNTLTCTSTGGPATTVTWRRDGVVITLNATHQQTKSLVYPDKGTYQTVLTIDPSVGQQSIVGTYNCTVENVRGESSKALVVTGWAFAFTLTFIIILLFNIRYTLDSSAHIVYHSWLFWLVIE